MPNQVVDPKEQARIMAEFSVRQQLRKSQQTKRGHLHFDWLWMTQSLGYLCLIAVAFYFDHRTNGRFPWRYGAALPGLLWLFALTAKIGTIEGKIDQLLALAAAKDMPKPPTSAPPPRDLTHGFDPR
jgi:FtsH-binding integral membrane protein